MERYSAQSKCTLRQGHIISKPVVAQNSVQRLEYGALFGQANVPRHVFYRMCILSKCMDKDTLFGSSIELNKETGIWSAVRPCKRTLICRLWLPLRILFKVQNAPKSSNHAILFGFVQSVFTIPVLASVSQYRLFLVTAFTAFNKSSTCTRIDFDKSLLLGLFLLSFQHMLCTHISS